MPTLVGRLATFASAGVLSHFTLLQLLLLLTTTTAADDDSSNYSQQQRATAVPGNMRTAAREARIYIPPAELLELLLFKP